MMKAENLDECLDHFKRSDEAEWHLLKIYIYFWQKPKSLSSNPDGAKMESERQIDCDVYTEKTCP